VGRQPFKEFGSGKAIDPKREECGSHSSPTLKRRNIGLSWTVKESCWASTMD